MSFTSDEQRKAAHARIAGASKAPSKRAVSAIKAKPKAARRDPRIDMALKVAQGKDEAWQYRSILKTASSRMQERLLQPGPVTVFDLVNAAAFEHSDPADLDDEVFDEMTESLRLLALVVAEGRELAPVGWSEGDIGELEYLGTDGCPAKPPGTPPPGYVEIRPGVATRQDLFEDLARKGHLQERHLKEFEGTILKTVPTRSMAHALEAQDLRVYSIMDDGSVAPGIKLVDVSHYIGVKKGA